ncbi:MAG: peptide-methionine (R)-S-oxide reductase MsrB [Flavobacteriaceae bacterium]|nr:peptide-methionine (R)-S-oxide reductase MsrB [Flavobacteriaceae bacterium]MCH1454242.1 peptide-methionine (R)-S-oxide reductase MsrB [Flavobacteriaceae bacterium]MDG1028789.1 peptide-methionine (R)-S-oxide reductase MsrB [Flavobacteriaceae bacterium]MDG1941223.1 peptide-methionine (R)-S-oxide reductase MsrB [Flavobacteriaceae bacterium]
MKNQVIFLVTLVLISCNGVSQEKKSREDKIYAVEKTDQEWKEELPKMSYMVLRKAATEYPFTGKYNNHKAKGIYTCAGCNTPLYKSENKYDSKCGWPSFDRAVESNIEYDVDYKLGYARTELKCNKCGGHLGHVFNDGPKETTGKRHCINSAALNFSPNE